MKNSKIATRYAKALFDLALENQKDEKVLQNLFDVAETIRQSRELSIVINSPVVNDDKKIAVLNAIFSSAIEEITLKFVCLIVKKNRELFINDIYEAFEDLYLKHHNITKVLVRSTIVLSEAIKNRIIAFVEKEAQSKVQIEEQIDEDLIGGLIISYDNKQFDSSIETRLKELTNDFNLNQYVGKY